MDAMKIREKVTGTLKKYRYAFLVVALGLVLMLLPERSEKQQEVPDPTKTAIQEPSISEQLSQILSSIEGAGKVEVLLTEAKGAETIYQNDMDTTSGENTSSLHQDTVLVTDAQREQQGLVRQVNPPVYQGAIVLCQGAERASVRLAIVEAVSSVTGLGTDRITVLKMK